MVPKDDEPADVRGHAAERIVRRDAVLDEALVQEAMPSEAECTHPNARIVSFNKDAGVEQTYYFGLRLDEFGLWQMIELAENEVGEDTLVQK